MGKVVGNVVRGVGKVIGGLFGGGEVPQAPALPPPPPPPPIAPEQAIKASTSDELKRKLNDRRRVSRKSTIQTGARGVTTEAPIEYATLLGGSTTKNR
jgi:hypothetical protein